MKGMTIRGMTFEPPLVPTNIIIVMKMRCLMCKDHFSIGDVWAPCPGQPLNPIELAKRDRGEPFQALSTPIHLDCVIERILNQTLWRTSKSPNGKQWQWLTGEA